MAKVNQLSRLLFQSVFGMLLLFCIGCSQTRVYKHSFDSMQVHLSEKFDTDLSSEKSSVIYPVDKVPELEDIQEIENPEVQRLVSLFWYTEDLVVEEYIPSQKLVFQLTRGNITRKFKVEALSESETEVTVDFLYRFLLFYSSMPKTESKFLSDLDSDLELEKVSNIYAKENGEIMMLMLGEIEEDRWESFEGDYTFEFTEEIE